MTEDVKLPAVKNSMSRSRKIVLGVITAIILGAIGSGLWDMLFKPGIGIIGRLITGASINIDNAVFTTAALDPTPISSLLVIVLISTIPLFPVLFFTFFIFRGKLIGVFFKRLIGRKNAEPQELSKKRIDRRLSIVAVIALIYSLLIFIAASIATTVLNNSVLIWRTFNKNIDICAPYISSEQHLLIVSSFRLMSSRKDFMKIKSELDEIAKQKNLSLEWYLN